MQREAADPEAEQLSTCHVHSGVMDDPIRLAAAPRSSKASSSANAAVAVLSRWVAVEDVAVESDHCLLGVGSMKQAY